MNNARITRLWPAIAAAAILVLGAAGAHAQAAWPNKPVHWIVPFPAGGSADVISRVVAQKLAERLGQPVVVESRSGASGNIGHEAVAKSPPDGYTVLFVVPGIVTNPFFSKASVDPFKDLAPVIQLDTVPMVLLASAEFQARTLPEVLTKIRQKPGWSRAPFPAPSRWWVARCCALTPTRTCCWCNTKGQSAGNERADGRRDQPDVRSDEPGGRLREVRPGARDRLDQLQARQRADARSGAGLRHHSRFRADHLARPHGAARQRQPEIVQRLNRELAAVLEQPDVRQRFIEGGFDIVGGTPAAFGELLRRHEYAKYGRVLKEAGVKPE